MHRELGGASFAELGLPEGLGRDEELEALHDSIDWAPFARLLRSIHGSREGRKAYPPLTMFKVCILQQWYGGASDPAIERALRRDLAFRRFVGLGLNDGQPDHSTIHRFRAQLERGGLAQSSIGRLFAELRRQQEAAELLLREGALLGAGGVIGIPARFGIAAALQAWSEYNANESCGKCTPCRGWPRAMRRRGGTLTRSFR